MELLKAIRADYFQAMKDKDALKKGVLSLVVSAANLQEKEKGQEISDEEVILIIQRELKQTKETLSLTPIDRQDLVDQSDAKIKLLNNYLPEQMSKEDLVVAIEKIAADGNLELIKKNQGLFMKQMMSIYQGQTDGKTLNAVLAGLLK